MTCSDDNTARVWDLDTGACLSVLQVGTKTWLPSEGLIFHGWVHLTSLRLEHTLLRQG